MTTQEELDILRATREILSDPSRYTARNSALDGNGRPVDSGSPEAVCFCYGGALERVIKQRKPAEFAGYWKLLILYANAVAQNVYPSMGSPWPYITTSDAGHGFCIRMADQAIKLCEQRLALLRQLGLETIQP